MGCCWSMFAGKPARLLRLPLNRHPVACTILGVPYYKYGMVGSKTIRPLD